MAATTPETFTRVGQHGPADLRRPARHGHPRAGRPPGHATGGRGATGAIPERATCACASPSTPRHREAAVEEPRETALYYFKRQAALTRAPLGRDGVDSVDYRASQAERLTALSYDDVLAKKVAFGTAAALVDRFTALRDELRLTGVAAELNPGGLLPMAQEMRTLQILTHEVMPAFR